MSPKAVHKCFTPATSTIRFYSGVLLSAKLCPGRAIARCSERSQCLRGEKTRTETISSPLIAMRSKREKSKEQLSVMLTRLCWHRSQSLVLLPVLHSLVRVAERPVLRSRLWCPHPDRSRRRLRGRLAAPTRLELRRAIRRPFLGSLLLRQDHHLCLLQVFLQAFLQALRLLP